ncbi:hypothetical protein [Roseicella aquatilis]|uniref:LacI family transcriptional regulator n=1 Tax=Roseicella aquatilis TaxID=2527868 RepID=A0A4R4DUL6_9PROT|nr:hypothetical protein [Roseicella aquatilis]TCZ63980.1 hypothetical protein EXY23_08360 [Roseicella aquatilis]
MTTATSITVRVPLAIRHRPGRKTVVTPDAQVSPSTTTRADPALVKAIARAHRYQRILDQGRHGSLTELAAAEKMDRSFLGKLLSLTLLAPDLVEAILEGQCDVGLPTLLRPFPAAWHEQVSALATKQPPPSLPETKARG